MISTGIRNVCPFLIKLEFSELRSKRIKNEKLCFYLYQIRAESVRIYSLFNMLCYLLPPSLHFAQLLFLF